MGVVAIGSFTSVNVIEINEYVLFVYLVASVVFAMPLLFDYSKSSDLPLWGTLVHIIIYTKALIEQESTHKKQFGHEEHSWYTWFSISY